jgi:3-methylcrotonyl-CoA carboxylase beta subunit
MLYTTKHPVTLLCSISAGVTDHFAQDEPHALAITRNIFANLNLQRGSIGSVSGSNVQHVAAMAAGGWDEPLYNPQELRGVVPPDSRTPWDVSDCVLSTESVY